VNGRRLDDGILADVAPTLLELADLPTWPAISGRSLLATGGAAREEPAGRA
jgi:bisphosphoglycerate-independent phosphoglycerate mutase (AlkP superfamily)